MMTEASPSYTVERFIPVSHPALAGHFPGNPVVPGVLILEEIVQAARAWRGAFRVVAIPSVKFIAPLYPGRAFTVELSGDRSRLRFECNSDERLIARGQLAVAADDFA